MGIVASGSVGDFSLDGKVALVTGGSRGLGREMVLGFARSGADVVIVGRNVDTCNSVAELVREQTGRRAMAYSCHVGRWHKLPELVDTVYDQFGRLDILVNNAGKSPLYRSLVDVEERLWDSVLAVNLKGPFRLSVLVGDRMAACDGGCIINVSSIAAIHPQPDVIPYAAAKAGLNALTAGLAQAYGPKVRVNCIMAGPFLTDVSKAWDMEAFAEHSQSYALKRGGHPSEIVGAALYLASDASSFTTGAIIAIDGGFSGSRSPLPAAPVALLEKSPAG
jgi:NAD(P)-dependent dehydrogenase (short-subunit alcohol dehydrogenase family)